MQIVAHDERERFGIVTLEFRISWDDPGSSAPAFSPPSVEDHLLVFDDLGAQTIFFQIVREIEERLPFNVERKYLSIWV